VVPAKAGTTNVADSLNHAFLNTLLGITSLLWGVKTQSEAASIIHENEGVAGREARFGPAKVVSCCDGRVKRNSSKQSPAALARA